MRQRLSAVLAACAVTVTEYERILASYQPDRLISAADIAVTTRSGVQPVLPGTVRATEGAGTSAQRDLGSVAVR